MLVQNAITLRHRSKGLFPPQAVSLFVAKQLECVCGVQRIKSCEVR